MNKRNLIRLLGCGIPIAFTFFIPLLFPGPYVAHILIFTLLNIVLASSLRLINLLGQISLAHGGMMAIGAYTSTLLVMKLGLSSWTALLLGGFFSASVACLIAFPFTRLKGMYFAIATLFLTAMIMLTAQQWRSLTGGPLGIYNIPRPDPVVIPGLLNITFSSRVDFYYLVLIIMLVSLIILYAIEHSRIGLVCRGIRQSDSLAQSVGINTTSFKVLVFSIGCFFPGLMGGFYSQYMSTINPDVFGFLPTLYILIYMVVGGSRKFTGPIVGAFVLTILPEVLRPLKQFQPFFFAGVLMLVIFFMPEGLAGLPERSKRWLGSFLKKGAKYA